MNSKITWVVETKIPRESAWYEWSTHSTQLIAEREARKVTKRRDLWAGTKVRYRSRRVVWGTPVVVR